MNVGLFSDSIISDILSRKNKSSIMEEILTEKISKEEVGKLSDYQIHARLKEEALMKLQVRERVQDANKQIKKQEAEEEQNKISITPREAWNCLVNQQSCLIDTRLEPQALFGASPDLSSIKKEVINIPYKLYPSMEKNPEFKERCKQYASNANTTTILICNDGNTSKTIIEEIRENHPNCFAVENGFNGEKDESLGIRGMINGWRADGLPCQEL